MALAASSLSSVCRSSPRPSLSISSHLHLHPSRHNITTTVTATTRFEFILIPRTRTTLTTVFSSLPTNPNSEHPNSTQPDEPDDEQPPPPSPLPSAKRSFAVATAEVVLGLASGVIKTIRNKSRGGRIAVTAGSSSSSSSVSLGGDSVPIRSSGNGVNLGKTDYEERIGAVLEDSLEPGVVWEQRVKDVEVEKRREKVTSPGFSFSAAGLLFPYHLGVAQCLMEKGYIEETTPLAGSSAGAIVCTAIASGRSMEETLHVTKQLADDCRLKGTAFRLGAVLRKVLEESLPDDAHTRCNGRVRVAVTQIFWRPRGFLVDQFDSKEDLINAVFTSSFVPGFLAPRPATMFRNQLCVDGGLTLFMPPTSADQTVRVCAFPASTLRLRGISISPDCNPGNRPSIRQLFNWALEPAEDDGLDKLFEFGYMDASVWAEQNPLSYIIKEDEL